MTRIFWDTNLFAYLLQGPSSPFFARVAEMLTRAEQRGDELVTSALSLGEILAGTGDVGLRARWRLEIESSASIFPFQGDAASIFAKLRHARKLKPPDAIQLATAAAAQVDLFITADKRLAATAWVPGIRFITTLDRAPI